MRARIVGAVGDDCATITPDEFSGPGRSRDHGRAQTRRLLRRGAGRDGEQRPAGRDPSRYRRRGRSAAVAAATAGHPLAARAPPCRGAAGRVLRRDAGRRHAVRQAHQRHRERPGGVPARLRRVDQVARAGDPVRRSAGHPGADRLGAAGRADRRRPGRGRGGQGPARRRRGHRRAAVRADPERGRRRGAGRAAAAGRQLGVRDAARDRRGRDGGRPGRGPALATSPARVASSPTSRPRSRASTASCCSPRSASSW